MAGFLETIGFGSGRQKLVSVSRFGTAIDDLLVKNSQGIGYIEGELRKRTMGLSDNDLFRYTMALSDTTTNMRSKMLAFFQLDYAVKRERLRDLASNAEIEFVVDTIMDDTIVYDDDGKFCYPNDLRTKLSTKVKKDGKAEKTAYEDKVVDEFIEVFEQIYNAWGWNNGISAWQMGQQYLTDGALAYEILYDSIDKPTQILGFKEMDPATLYPMVKADANGKLYIEWIQRDDTTNNPRTLIDSQVLYLSYSNHFRTKRVSFVERMIRSFNMLRIIEHSKVIWHVMNAPVRLKTEVPIGTKSIQKAKEELGEFLNTFKEDIFFNNETGELLVDGKPRVLFYKNYVVPSNDRGEKIDISSIEHTGPDLQDNALLGWFLKKLKLDSKLPFSRWDYNEGGGSYLLGPDTVSREEIAYGKFIKRMRTALQELMIKPLYIQMCLNIPELKNDMKFKNAIGVTFNEDNVFEKLKKAEIAKKSVEVITQLQTIKNSEDSKLNVDFLLKKFGDFTENDVKANEEAWQNALERKKVEGAQAGGGGGQAGAGAPAAGGGGGGAAPVGGGGQGPLAGPGEAGGGEQAGTQTAGTQAPGAQAGGQAGTQAAPPQTPAK